MLRNVNLDQSTCGLFSLKDCKRHGLLFGENSFGLVHKPQRRHLHRLKTALRPSKSHTLTLHYTYLGKITHLCCSALNYTTHIWGKELFEWCVDTAPRVSSCLTNDPTPILPSFGHDPLGFCESNITNLRFVYKRSSSQVGFARLHNCLISRYLPCNCGKV